MHFQIVPTTLCNARCFYCYENDCMFETMQTSVVEATIDFIKKYIVDNPDDNYSIDWFGGEPMLVPELILYMANEILQYCKDRLVNINSEIVTNASKINAESIYFFESIGISRVHISIDGMREEYEKRKAFVDGKKYFDQIISAIQLLTNHDIQVMLRVNVDKNNIDSCYQLIEYLKETLSQKVEIHVAPLYGCGNSYLTADNVTSVLTKLQSKIDSMGFKRTIRKSINEKYCRDSQQRNLVIKPDVDIIHCEHMYNEKNAIIGNVFDGITSDTGWICDKCKNYTICKLGCTDEKKIDCTACWKTIWRN